MKLQQIAILVDGTLVGDPEIEIKGVYPLLDAEESHIAFILDKEHVKHRKSSRASAFVTFKKLDLISNQIVVKDPRRALAQIIEMFSEKQYQPLNRGISSQAHVDSSAQVSQSAIVEPFVVIGPGTIVGDGAHIMSHVRIGSSCRIGPRCKLFSNVVIYDDVRLGEDVSIHAGTVIGSDGFGYYQEMETWHKIKQIGSVIIENSVEIGANVAIDRGCLGPTVIGEGTKIDNLVHISHNTNLGKNCAIAGQVGFIGSVEVGNSVQIGGQAGIGAKYIGAYSLIAGKSSVTRAVPEYTKIKGNPAQEMGKEQRYQATLRRIVKEWTYKRKGETQ